MGKNLIRIFPKELEEFDKNCVVFVSCDKDILSVYIAITIHRYHRNLPRRKWWRMIFSIDITRLNCNSSLD